MAINFPDSPTNGETHAVGSFTWQYDGEKWVAANGIALDGLSDVTAPTPTSGDFLKWNGTAWVNDPVNLGTDTTGNYLNDITAGTGLTISHTPGEGSSASVSLNATLDNLSDVTAPSPADGEFLKYVSASSAWVPAAIPTINALDDVGDVTAPSPTVGQFLQWNGTAWVNADVSTNVMTSSQTAAIIIMDIGA